jgi:ubiquinone biosynthesis protein
VDRLARSGVDIPRLARAGVEVFFTQVFRDGYFHADMHPGNIFVATDPASHGKYIAVDFGIMGTLSERDQHYLAVNFLAFFRRDYQRCDRASGVGWVPPDTRMDDLEAGDSASCSSPRSTGRSPRSPSAACCSRSSARRAGSASRSSRSSSCLQKTLLNVEGLGRQLDPISISG